MNILSRLQSGSEKKDEISFNGDILSINGVIYDLKNLNHKPIPEYDTDGNIENKEIIESFKDKIWKDSEGNIFASLVYDKETQFMFINGNLLRFYDIDESGDISIKELKTIVEFWNKTEEERRIYHKSVLDNK